ncbi:AlpA family phage regulatory protein [Methylobacterium sp. E-065]|uniref:helix-turn-helix transcriptional regulator n=1 Tax=Methylobacterium sp. E-065 TaxID=2836583 RepID=UPI001FB95BA1|nr:AlpA family phage regulatory protein [Methylobacterium sp. E-065]MCJ2018613.1 AlpA family phage regulatory protein [Methylobacterium sp. E-065]
MTPRYITQREVETKTGLSGATLHRLRRKGRFPDPIKIGERRIAWPENEIDTWLATRERQPLRSASAV